MDDHQLFEMTASHLDRGGRAALVTVIAAEGSTPGKIGFKMLVPENGEAAGTVGGGIVEARMIEEARREMREPRDRIYRFELGGASEEEENGICGGAVELLLETFGREAAPLFRGLLDATERGLLLSIVSPDGRCGKWYLRDAGEIEALPSECSPEIARAVRESFLSDRGPKAIRSGATVAFLERLAWAPRMILFGAGHLGEQVARFARPAGFRVTVWDDRAEYANGERFPDAETVVVDEFPHAPGDLKVDEETYVVIVTRGHKHDELVLERILRTPAKYIGMIGSRRKTLTLLDGLRERGAGAESFGRVYAPVGLDIGAVTPEEIALSIVAELIKVRRGDGRSPADHLKLARGKEGT